MIEMVTCSGGRGQTREGQDQGAGPGPAALGSAGHCSRDGPGDCVPGSHAAGFPWVFPVGIEADWKVGGGKGVSLPPSLPQAVSVHLPVPAGEACALHFLTTLSPVAPGLVGLSALAPLWVPPVPVLGFSAPPPLV